MKEHLVHDNLCYFLFYKHNFSLNLKVHIRVSISYLETIEVLTIVNYAFT
jgi:hypothetical protein